MMWNFDLYRGDALRPTLGSPMRTLGGMGAAATGGKAPPNAEQWAFIQTRMTQKSRVSQSEARVFFEDTNTNFALTDTQKNTLISLANTTAITSRPASAAPAPTTSNMIPGLNTASFQSLGSAIPELVKVALIGAGLLVVADALKH